jgi:nicotinate-nucleotide pyrophosphorylase (carboxylating)
VQRALDEDLGRAGDITSNATIPEAAKAHAILVARQAGVIAGLPLAVATLQKLSADVNIQPHCRDGATVAAGLHVLTISGPARAVLAAERTALNFVGRLSGIATLTSDYVRHTAGTKMRICCTRKTTPGLRALEKYAVRCGGGFNHRFGLDDAILIKDNHIAVAGGIKPVLQRARAHIGHLVKVEIEVDTLEQLHEVLATGLADVVLLDNMDIATLTEAVRMANGRVVLEASGGVTQASIAKIAATGVDYASSGTLTHSAPNFDVAFDIDA